MTKTEVTRYCSVIVPFAAYLILSQIPGQFPDLYPYLYTACIFLVAGISFVVLRGSPIIRPHRAILPGLLFGVLGIVLWIVLASLQLEELLMVYLPDWLRPEQRSAFEPFMFFDNPTYQWGFIGIRIMGLALLVPLVEEVFWRGFLLRWVISPDWYDRPIGEFTPGSFSWIVFLFALAHPEWLAALVYCALMNILLYWQKDLWNCIIAHGVSNLLLAIYVISTGNWQLW